MLSLYWYYKLAVLVRLSTTIMADVLRPTTVAVMPAVTFGFWTIVKKYTFTARDAILYMYKFVVQAKPHRSGYRFQGQ